jgi:peptide/nickel transport system substrate-binding protein
MVTALQMLFFLVSCVSLLVLGVATWGADNTIVLGFEGEAASLDPVAGTNLATLRVLDLIGETLVAENVADAKAVYPELIPGLAERWDISKDGLVYTFHLRKGVKFHDGAPFNAQAVKFNLDRVKNQGFQYFYSRGFTTLNQDYKWIKDYRAKDDYTLEITLQEPFSSFLRLLAHRNCIIISPDSVKKYGNDEVGKYPSGTGPFVLEKREGYNIFLKRNPDYWGKKPNLERVIIRAIPESGARYAALMQGEIDVDFFVNPDNVKDIQTNPRFELVLPNQPHTWYIALNMKHTPTQYLKVRQALQHAVDMQTIIKSIYPGNSAMSLHGPLPVGNPAYNPQMNSPYSYDPYKAKALLKEAGYGSGVEMRFAYPTSGISFMAATQMMEMIQGYLLKVGVKAVLEPVEYRAFLQLIRPGVTDKLSGFVIGWQSICADPYMLEQLFGAQFQPPNGNNQGWYSNPDADTLLSQARKEPNEKKSIELYRAAEQLIVKDAAAIFGAKDKFARAVNKRVQGLTMGPSPYISLTNVVVK